MDANDSVVNIGNSIVAGTIDAPLAAGIYLSGEVVGTLTITDTASVSGDSAIHINGDMSRAELVVKGQLRGEQQAIDWENATSALKVTVSGGDIEGAITDGNTVNFGLVTVNGVGNHFRRRVGTEYFHVESDATAHIYDEIGPINNTGAIVIEGDLIIESDDEVVTRGTLVLSPDSNITIKHIRTGGESPSITHEGDVSAPLWNRI